MSWTQQLFNYCERALNPEIWGEPLNALSNLGFILAALLALRLEQKMKRQHPDLFINFLIFIVFLIGIGSGLFHTFATRWSAIADVLPITVFIFSFLVFSLRRFLGFGIIGTIMVLIAFALLSYVAGSIKCANGPCLNGTIGYLPALAALLAIGTALLLLGRPAAKGLLTAGLVFGISASFRTIDKIACEATTIAGYPTGTHFIWHILNALTLGILLYMAVLHGNTAEKNTGIAR